MDKLKLEIKNNFIFLVADAEKILRHLSKHRIGLGRKILIVSHFNSMICVLIRIQLLMDLYCYHCLEDVATKTYDYLYTPNFKDMLELARGLGFSPEDLLPPEFIDNFSLQGQIPAESIITLGEEGITPIVDAMIFKAKAAFDNNDGLFGSVEEIMGVK